MRWLLALLVCAACGDAPPVGPDATSCELVVDVPAASTRRVDILFVVDESAGMAPYQARLAENAARFVQVLESVEGGIPWFHIGVVSADLARDGVFVAPMLVYDKHFDGTVEQSWQGPLADAFVPQLLLGTDGGESRPLEAARRALDGRNAGFRRADAHLFVVMISSSDDPDDVVLDVDASAAVAPGLDPFAEVMVPIDNEDWTGVMEPIASRLTVVTGMPCFSSEPLDCAVSVELTDGTERVLPACADGGALPCYIIDDLHCPSVEPDGYATADVRVFRFRCAALCD